MFLACLTIIIAVVDFVPICTPFVSSEIVQFGSQDVVILCKTCCFVILLSWKMASYLCIYPHNTPTRCIE
ncbi:hypothetical protein M758_11G037700 [Ceratodon purpureus]|nr:hypothetical protein M758_11G037700 [Ceratodon purpureus]